MARETKKPESQDRHKKGRGFNPGARAPSLAEMSEGDIACKYTVYTKGRFFTLRAPRLR